MKGLTFSQPMMLAWLVGRKSVTRRLMNPQPDIASDGCIYYPHRDHPKWLCYANESHFRKGIMHDFKPRYLPGETVYIKEVWAQIWNQDGCLHDIEYKADTGAKYPADWPDDSTGDPSCPKWKSPRIMPEWASRSKALIVSAKPERIQEITEEEAIKEGFCPPPVPMAMGYDGPYETAGPDHPCYLFPTDLFCQTWGTLRPGSWERNDFVWRLELKKVKP
jgi:hypothetical protein